MRWRFCEPYCQPGWCVLVSLGCWLGLCRGQRMAPLCQCAGCRQSLGTRAHSGSLGMGAYRAEGPDVGSVGRGSCTRRCEGAFGWRVCGALRRPDWCAVVWAGGLVSPLPGGLPAGGRVWTRRVVFWFLEAGHLWGPGLGAFAGVRCQGVARVGCLLPPYSWSWARLPSRQVTPGAPRPLWLRGVVTGVVVPLVWTHVLARGSVACQPPMVQERP